MDGDRRQAYLNLIEVLVSCPSGEEPAIIIANQNLINAGLVQTMLDFALNLATRDYRDYIDASNRLINIVVDLLVTLRNADEGSQEFSKAIEYYEQVRANCQERSYQQMEAMLLSYIRLFYRYTNDYAKAIESSERLLVIAQNRKERFLEAEALLHLGIDYQGLDNLDEARNDYEQSLAIAEQIDTEASKKLQVDILNALGESYNPPYAWHLSKATQMCLLSLQIARKIGYRYGEATALTHIGKAHYSAPGQGRNFSEAIRRYEEAKTIFQEIENLQGEWDALYHLQDSYNYTSEYAKAIDYNQRLLTSKTLFNKQIFTVNC